MTAAAMREMTSEDLELAIAKVAKVQTLASYPTDKVLRRPDVPTGRDPGVTTKDQSFTELLDKRTFRRVANRPWPRGRSE